MERDMKPKSRYLVLAQPINDELSIEFVSAHDTYEEAQEMRDKCREGDDRHDPCEYFIEEK